MNKKYYKVKCKCGHVGKNHYIAIAFAVMAENKKEAAQIARLIPRCKHHHKDCILDVTEVSFEEYILIYKDNKEDPYLNCSNIQDQRKLDLTDRLIEERYIETHKVEKTNHKVYEGKTIIRNPKKFARFYCLHEKTLSLQEATYAI